MKEGRLLAKSFDQKRFVDGPPDYALLVQHTRDVANACRALADVIGPVALDVAGMAHNQLPAFAATLRLNGWSQDIGKANSHFQAMVSTTPEIQQLVRHETLSGMLLWLEPDFRRWLGPVEAFLTPAIWGAIGHHRKFDDRITINQGTPLTVHVAHEDFGTMLREMAADFDLAPPPHFESDFTLGRDRRDGADRSAVSMLNEMIENFRDGEPEYEGELARRSLALVKGLGVAADVAASAVARQGVESSRYSLDAFVRQKLSIGLTREQLTGLINSWAWKRYEGDAVEDVTQPPPGFVVRTFQKRVESSPSFLTLAEAGCGSGKSLAAYLWARSWCIRRETEQSPVFRLFFCLPTTGTTTEHFKDYALEAGISTDLVHSRSAVDMHTLAGTADQEESEESTGGQTHDSLTHQRQAARAALASERDKIEGLALWETRLAVTTADTVLGVMANARRGLCALPAILQSAIVFDEIHAFDDHLFGHLLVFLRNFPRLPVLLMTASLPDERRRALLAVRPDLETIAGPPDLEQLPRYKIEETNAEGAWAAVKEQLYRKGGGKVLWVRNRVDWTNRTYEAARDQFKGIQVDVYHSRLRYMDRSHRHRRVIDRFQKAGTPTLLIATQVAEMSLDLSADLLITDEAPIPSLIQRLGRLNRRATPEFPGEPKRALVEVVASGDELPYSSDELSQSRVWRSRLAGLGRPLSQRDLATQFSFTEEGRTSDFDYNAAEERACFIGVPDRSGLWRTRPGKTRAEGYTVTVIFKDDLDEHRRARGAAPPSSSWLREHEVAIPMKDDVLAWERVAGLPIAPRESVLYDYDQSTREGTGARWRKN